MATVDIPNILKYADEYTKRLGIYQDNVPTEVTTLSVIPALPTLLTNIDGEANLTEPADEVETAEKYTARVRKEFDEMMDSEKVMDWTRTFGDKLDVEKLLFIASTWLTDNTDNRKVRLLRFYGNWLRRSYERA